MFDFTPSGFQRKVRPASSVFFRYAKSIFVPFDIVDSSRVPSSRTCKELVLTNFLKLNNSPRVVGSVDGNQIQENRS